MAVHWDLIFSNLSDRIDDLEKEVSERLPEMCAVEAKVSYNNLISVYKEMVEYETQAKTIADTDRYYLINQLFANRKTHLRVFKLKLKLAKIFSSDESILPTETDTNLDIQSNPTKQPTTESKINNDQSLHQSTKTDSKNTTVSLSKQSTKPEPLHPEQIESSKLKTDLQETNLKRKLANLEELYNRLFGCLCWVRTVFEEFPTRRQQEDMIGKITQEICYYQEELEKIMQP
ncbi:uncharacterized protein LOC135844852 [Planococcus citri]|uniref:uncharacterized protein LOC135844852 n=1 Tax=Planococcus citri TaxID=170843 RepID=UPI0031F8EAC7